MAWINAEWGNLVLSLACAGYIPITMALNTIKIYHSLLDLKLLNSVISDAYMQLHLTDDNILSTSNLPTLQSS